MASSQDCKKFIAEIAPIIQRTAKRNGYKLASPILAQACVESDYGVSLLGKKYFNYFGLKCGSSWKGKSVNLSTKEEYTPGVLTSIRDNFRVFDDMESGVQGYFDFISTKRYSNLKSATTPQEYLERIVADKYCTSTKYVNTCMNVIRKWNLTQYDDFNAVPVGQIDTIHDKKPTLKIGDRGDWVRVAQARLYIKCYKIKVDGIFGEKTKDAVIQFQEHNGLKPDGIIGEKTWDKLY